MRTHRPLARAVLVTVATATLLGTAGLASAHPGAHAGGHDAGTHCRPAHGQPHQQASRSCSKAKSTAAVSALADTDLAEWAAVAAGSTSTGIPADLLGTLQADAAAAQAEVEALVPQIADANSSQLAHLRNELRSLDPTRLQAALTDLDTALAAYAGDPTDLLGGVAVALTGFDPADVHSHLQALTGAVRDAAEAVTAATATAPVA
jgi:hypothetical protein